MSRFIGIVSAYAYAVSQGYTGTEEEYAELMASYATVAEQAAESAESASQSATSASASAQTATTKASEASQSATQAGTKASQASTSATQAGASATSASQSASTATTKASEASASASTAGTKASEASQSATTASSKASEASASATSAQTAQGLAEGARDDAIDAKTDAETARDLAQQYAESINPENIYSVYPTDTASGAVASFADGADDIPMKSVKVAIEPVQDLHGYDHPWPGGGGVNLAENMSPSLSDLRGITVNTAGDGTITINGTSEGTSYIRGYFHCPDQTATYTWAVFNTAAATDLEFSVRNSRYNPAGGWAPLRTANMTLTFTIDSEETAIYWQFAVNNGATINNVVLKPMIVSGSTAPASYSPYSNICPISGWTGAQVSHSGADRTNPTTYSITFPTEAGTVYGGTLDVTNGVLTVDRAMVTYDGSENWGTTLASGGNAYRIHLDALPQEIKVPASSNEVADVVTNILPANSADNTWYKHDGIAIQDTYEWRIYCSQYNTSDITPWKEFLANNHLTVCCKLATPITYNLTPPTEIKSLLGDNNVWADCGDTTVTYRADTAKYIDKKIAEVINALS